MPKILNCFEQPARQTVNPADILMSGPSTASQFGATAPHTSNNTSNVQSTSNLSGIFHLYWNNLNLRYIVHNGIRLHTFIFNASKYFLRTSGVFTGLKWGAHFNLWLYAPSSIPPSIMKLISMGLASSTWSSYQTAWWAFRAYCIHDQVPATLPVSLHHLLNYIEYLANWRHLQASTISGYVSALKALHYLNGFPLESIKPIFTNFWVHTAIRGADHSNKLQEKSANPRRVMSFECLKLLGILVSSNISNAEHLMLIIVIIPISQLYCYYSRKVFYFPLYFKFSNHFKVYLTNW